MNSESDDIYCRLCAESKHICKQVDLERDIEKQKDVVNKLVRINAPTEFIDSKLPTTVCHECIWSLDKCYDFVVRVECAQKTLGDIVTNENVKKECQSDDDQSDIEMPVEETECTKIKTEPVEPEDTKELESQAPGKAQKVKKSVSIDSIPLSQLRQTWENYSWLCTFCQMHFNNIDELQTHSMAIHSVCNPYRCSKCKVRKQCLDTFLIHIQKHNKNLKYSCYKCFKNFKTLSSTQKHRKSHVDTELNCPGCNSTFKTSEDQKIHKNTYCKLKTSNKIEMPSISMDGRTCLICSKTFKNKTNVKLHILRVHSEKHQDHVCEICGKAFYDKHNHATHMLHVHTNYRPHKCHICQLGFKTTKSLKDHVGRHYNEKPLACDKCGKNFRLKKHLKKHSVIHTDQLPFKCNYCDKRFQRKQYLTNHLMQHTGERPYSCEDCDQHFTNWGNYNKHMICRHNQDTARKKAVLVDEL